MLRTDRQCHLLTQMCYEGERKKQTIMGLKKTNGAGHNNNWLVPLINSINSKTFNVPVQNRVYKSWLV